MEQLTMRLDRFLCQGCQTLARHDYRMVCDKCHGDFLRIVELYQFIVRERPDLRSLTMPELFARMYQAVRKKR